MKNDIEIERLATIGEMMGNISHQWKQPLNNIALLVMNIDNTYRKGKMTIDYMEDKVDAIEETIEYMSQTIEDFSDYLNPNRVKSSFYLSDSVEKAMELTMPTLTKSKVDIIFYDEDDYELYGRRNELTQVLIILINNAKEALLRDINNKNRSITITLEKIDKDFILTISDNGLGVPTELLTKVFEAYFSTNEQTKGRGLGLYMAKKIINEGFNGKIELSNDNGAVFKLILPEN
jgi:C4-dicarboxylate-specific signal transduction histidine kinase